MFYPMSVWKAEKDIYCNDYGDRIDRGETFTVLEVSSGSSLVRGRDGSEMRFYDLSKLRACSLISYEDCPPVFFLRRGERYYQPDTSTENPKRFGISSAHNFQYNSDADVLRELSKYLYTSNGPFGIFSYEMFSPATGVSETHKISHAWCHNAALISKNYGRLSDWWLERIPEREINILAILQFRDVAEHYSFADSIASWNIRNLYAIDNPEDIPLLKLHYGDDITIFESEWAEWS